MSPYRHGPMGDRARCEALAKSAVALERQVLPTTYARLPREARDELARAKARTLLRARSAADFARLEELLHAYHALLAGHAERTLVVEPAPLREPPLPDPDLRHEPQRGVRADVLEERAQAFVRALAFVDPAVRCDAAAHADHAADSAARVVRSARFQRGGAPYALVSALEALSPPERKARGAASTHVLRSVVSASHPALTVAPESDWTRLGKALGLVDELTTGDPPFDRAFVLRSPEVPRARPLALLTPALRRGLVALSDKVLRLEVGDGIAEVAWSGYLEVSDLLSGVAVLASVRDAKV